MGSLYLKIILLFLSCFQDTDEKPLRNHYKVKRGIEEPLIKAAIDFFIFLIQSIAHIQENVARLPTDHKMASFDQEEMIDGVINLALNAVGQLSSVQETLAYISK